MPPFELVRLPCGAHAIRSVRYGEICHPTIGPAAEAEALYVTQLRLRERMAAHAGEFVIWDIGLGAGANALAALRAAYSSGRARPPAEPGSAGFQPASNRPSTGPAEKPALRLLSFDHSQAALAFARAHAAELGYFEGFEPAVDALLAHGQAFLASGPTTIAWQFVAGDFPRLIADAAAPAWPKPHAILFDPHAPARNPDMWTLPLFTRLHALIDAARPCALATYTRSSAVRTALLLAGFHVGAGQAVAGKEETTVAANRPELAGALLDARWLRRARASHGAEPLRESVFQQRPLADATWEALRAHPQFGVAKAGSPRTAGGLTPAATPPVR